jgi:hypothetical protein
LFKKNSIKHIGKSRYTQLMKKYTSIALIGVLVVGMAGFISLDAISATSFATMKVASDVHETSKMIGHVTYELRGADGNIKHYFQSDNMIVDAGTDCAAAAIFDPDDAVCTNLLGDDGFAYVAIGNATVSTDGGVTGALAEPDDTALDTSGGGSINFGTGSGTDPKTAGDEMGRSLLIDAGITSASLGTTTVSIASLPFEFDAANLDVGPRGTLITQSGLFDSTTGGNMFSIRDIPPVGTGLAVTNADTLSVTWTITLE